jgi:hypothetical protein
VPDTDFGISNKPGPSGWRRVILPFRWLTYRLLLPWIFRQEELHEELEESLAKIEVRRELLHQELMGVRSEIEATTRELAAIRSEIAATDQRVRQALAFGWDHVALVRRLAAIEDRLSLPQASASESDERILMRFPYRGDLETKKQMQSSGSRKVED